MGIADQEADDLDQGLDPLTGERSVFEGPAEDCPGVGHLPADPDQAMIEWVKELIGGGAKPGEIAVLRRTHAGVVDCLDVLEGAAIDYTEVRNNSDEARLHDAVRVMTMHRAKGLNTR